MRGPLTRAMGATSLLAVAGLVAGCPPHSPQPVASPPDAPSAPPAAASPAVAPVPPSPASTTPPTPAPAPSASASTPPTPPTPPTIPVAAAPPDAKPIVLWSSPTDGPLVGCDLAATLQRLGKGCRRVAPTHVATSHAPADADKAADGSACTSWSAEGRGPRRVRITLAGDSPIAAVVFVPELTPPRDHPWLHLSLRDGERALSLASSESWTAGGVPSLAVLPTRAAWKEVDVRYEGRASTSGFREIVLVTCDGPATPPAGWKVAEAPPPLQPMVEDFTVGGGFCTRDEQCAPEPVCHPMRCLSVKPPSGGLGAGMGCDQAHLAGQVSPRDCACREKTCGVLRHRPR